MAKTHSPPPSVALQATLHFLLLAISLRHANAANPLSFFMHDIFGGSAPSERVVAGITANTHSNGLPFAKHYRGIFPPNNNKNGIINNNNIPVIAKFGTVTVFDDELTEGHELGSAIIGKAQGFYLASSMDGSSHTMVFTALFRNDDREEEDCLSFFGVHRTPALQSHIAIVGGTGKYENAEGYATIETLHQPDQHLTDGVDTVLQFNVYITH